ncbi:hypothetical protein [Deinococcus pimensis]|uniref:hypothetical protein n=1 Tax=Deinococcus pimensis TaxID=309888 RepID=UPI000489EB26|nr:hypothetical protein [Deinococcus pimensis]
MDVIVETIPDGAQNEHVVVESPLDWLPPGSRILIEPPQVGYDNRMQFGEQEHSIRNVRVIDGHDPARTRTAFEVSGGPEIDGSTGVRSDA